MPPAFDFSRRGTLPGVVLGIGLGGFMDGIFLHQVVHWHNMVSAIVPPVTLEAVQQNMIWDGLFHAAVWIVTVAGVFLLLREVRRGATLPTPGRFVGLLLVGWGLFNLVEGLLNHHILQLHHVKDLPTHVPLYDWLFLGIGGVAFIIIGIVMAWPMPNIAERRRPAGVPERRLGERRVFGSRPRRPSGTR